MKSQAGLVLIAAVALVGTASGAPLARTKTSPSEPSLSQAQMEALVKADLKTCDQRIPVVPAASVRSVSSDRLARTLHGIWRGRVAGEYPKELLAQDGYLNVDYYWIIDAQRGEALILEQLSSTRSALEAPAANAPVWSFMTCGKAGYVPQHPPQVHEFQKISDSLEDARRMFEKSTGLQMEAGELSLSDAWHKLVETKYFDTKRYGAYAGGLFKPFEIMHTTNAAGTPMISLRYSAEYRGAGQTAAKFEEGVPIVGSESASFVGLTTPAGDYLVSSAGNGVEWEKMAEAVAINMAIDKVVIGPLAP
jgi:hypothetical protein